MTFLAWIRSTLSVDFGEGTHLEVSYVVFKDSKNEGWKGMNGFEQFTSDPGEFISAYQNQEKSAFGVIHHDYFASPPIRTQDGKIFLHLCDSRALLASQLISGLERLR